MGKKIVTSGRRYIDIDGYGCMLAYAELLNLQGETAVAHSSSVLNESIPHSLIPTNPALVRTIDIQSDDQFIVVDVSNPDFFDTSITHLDAIIEIIDHHAGHEDFWKERIGNNAQIEMIGAACTFVYERWKSAGILDKMTVASATALACGILDNTLNFGSDLTHERDVQAYAWLTAHANLTDTWAQRYFEECEQSILEDVPVSIQNDTKTEQLRSHNGESMTIGQLVVTDAASFIRTHKTTIQTQLSKDHPLWFMNTIDVMRGKNLLFTTSPESMQWLERTLNVHFDAHGIATTEKMWLRKQILKADIDQAVSASTSASS